MTADPGARPPSRSPEAVRRERVALAVAQLLLLAPFLDKPVHIDDAFFLAIARHILEDPFAPFGFDYNWAGTTSPVWGEMKNPPGVFYLQALLLRIGGDGVRWLHAAFALFPLAAGQGAYSLAARLVERPLLPALLLAMAPAWWVSATSLMIDVPLVAAMIGAVACFERALTVPRGGIGWRLGAGACAAFAVLAKYFGLAIVPLLAVQWLLAGRRRAIDAVVLVLPLLAFGLWWWASGGHFAEAVGYRAQERAHWGSWLALHGLAASTFAGGLLGFPVALLGGALLGRDPRERGLGLLALSFGVVAAGLLAFVQPSWRPVDLVQGALLAAGAALALGVLLATVPPDRLGRVLWCWLAGALVFAVALNWTLNARTIVLLTPPAVLLFGRYSEARPGLRAAALATSLAIGALVAAADAELAGFGPAETQRVVRELEGQRVRFAGHWGFQHYMEAAGYAHVELDRPDSRPGDVVVAPAMHQIANGGIASLRSGRSEWYEHARRIPVAVMDGAVGAGLHGSFLGPLPFAFTTGPLERVEVLRW